jgi:hypothetical protein
MKMYWRMEVQVHHSHPDHLMKVSGQLHAFTTLLLGKQPLILIVEEAACAPQLVWTSWRRGKFLVPTEN